MQVEFTKATVSPDGQRQLDPNEQFFEVTIDGKFWGFVDGPIKGQRTGRTWMSIKGFVDAEGVKRADPLAYWNQGHPNQHAAVLAAL